MFTAKKFVSPDTLEEAYELNKKGLIRFQAVCFGLK